MDLETLKKKALNVLETDMKAYQEAIEGIPEWEKRECTCGEAKFRWCSKCSWIDYYNRAMKRIEEKYKSA